MLEKLALLKTAGRLAEHAMDRQTVTARNVANSDTPGYRARDLPSFASVLRSDSEFALSQTRSSHLPAHENRAQTPAFIVDAPADPNGNTVTLESELVRATRAKREHDLALTIYQSTMNIVRSSLGRGR